MRAGHVLFSNAQILGLKFVDGQNEENGRRWAGDFNAVAVEVCEERFLVGGMTTRLPKL